MLLWPDMIKYIMMHKVAAGITAAVVLAIGISAVTYSVLKKSSAQSFQTFTVEQRDITATVNVTGNVIAAQDIPLSFEQGGNVTGVYANVGDHVGAGQKLAALDQSGLDAELVEAQAGLDTAKIKLENLASASVTPYANQSASDVQTSLSNNAQNLVDKITDSYLQTDNILGVYVDQFFSSPESSTPVFQVSMEQINPITQAPTVYTISIDPNLREKIDSEKIAVGALLKQWQAANQNLSDDTHIQAAANIGEQTLLSMQSFLTDIATAINSYTTSPDSNSQQFFGTFVNDVSTARTSANAALSELRSAIQTYNSAQATVSPYDLGLQQASVESAEGQVQAIQTQIAQTILLSPIDGTVSEQNAKIGSTVTPGMPIAEVISDGQPEIDAYVSEADVAKITVGEDATATLDALGTDTGFAAHVIQVNPSESMQNGVGSYEVKLQFDTADDTIKPGMTANVSIVVGQAKAVLAVPIQSVITKDDQKYVLLASDANKDTYTDQLITTGISDSNYIEVDSGLQSGQIIAAFGNNN